MLKASDHVELKKNLAIVSLLKENLAHIITRTSDAQVGSVVNEVSADLHYVEEKLRGLLK